MTTLWIVAALAVIHTIGIAVWFWPGHMPDTDSAGVWTALADDVAHGDWYRPLFGPLGTGGTRYMPLFFALHGAAIHAGATPLAAGAALTLGTSAAFAVALGALLRQLGIRRAIAWPAAALMFGTVTFGMLLLTVRGDFLAAALNLGGVAVALRWREKGGNALLLFAALLFAAAFLTKLTTIFGLVGVAGWMLHQREGGRSARLLAVSAALMAVGVALALQVSEGRMLVVFRAVGHGGATTMSALSGPWRFASECARDPLFCLFFVPGVALALATAGRVHVSLPRWLLAATLLVTLVIYGSPGTSSNHLIDLHAFAALQLALAVEQGGRMRACAGVALGVFGIGVVAPWLPGVPSIPAFFLRTGLPEAAAPGEFIRRAGSGARPMLAENPLVPILAGERPFVADWFNLALMSRRDPAVREAISARLRRGEFGSVVLTNWPVAFTHDVTSPADPSIAAGWAELEKEPRLFAEFYPLLQARYRVVSVRRPYVYFLRDDLPFAASP
ncbi:MAG: hypothetical protein RLZZ15_977 [Verrucomicrobiota bacterium]